MATNKIVILDNSVELYEHYIDDLRWERTLSFKRGGLTYLISNGTIKFYAYIDYLYRNCIMSMQLPLYIVDEKRGIDGEYSDIDEITELLDPIFPSNDIEAELDYYLTKVEAAETYQPIGDYALKSDIPDVSDLVTDEELVEALDDYYTKEETDDLLDDKLDVSAYTPFDPSDYYTKIEVDNLILSGGSFDPDQYYNKSEADNRFALKNEIPSLSGYATQEWVINQHYVTNSTLQQYITNLQQQITSIIESISGCCSSSGETLYRWITLTGENDFICSGTTKYEKQQKQQSTDNGMTWTNVVPAEYQRGAVLETDSPDCGWTPEPQYRWQSATTEDYLCSGTSKYYKVYYEVSNDGGQTWQHVQPEQTRMGDLIESASTDCGYIEPQYRWKAAPQSDYLCSGTSKYYKVYYEVSYDGGHTWQHVQPEQTKIGNLIEAKSTDCGYVPTNADKYLTFIAKENDTFSFNGTSLNKVYYSLDSGTTWNELENGTNTPTIPSGSTVMWKGTMTPATVGIGKFSSSGMFEVEGNPMSLLYGDNFENQTSLNGKDYAFRYLFSGCTKVTSVENYVLPATTLSNYCYHQMFKGCTSLTTVSSDLLPATTMKRGCYGEMFQGCTSLTTVAELPATTLATDCYNSMYNQCTSLTTAKKLPATILADDCYHLMFSGCTSLATVPSDMLPATTLKSTCYGEMFKDCTSLTKAPDLPAPTLLSYCYNGMFNGCTSLNYIKCLAISITAQGCTTAWVSNVASNGTFVKASTMSNWTSGQNGIPANWTIVNNT